eukprot:SAG31_NODE_600_length_13647_cov_3.894376_15_plen_129_part_00
MKKPIALLQKARGDVVDLVFARHGQIKKVKIRIQKPKHCLETGKLSRARDGIIVNNRGISSANNMLCYQCSYVPPAAANGKVPRNEHGNWELWGGNLAFLPQGCRYINLPYVAATARDLGTYVYCIQL